MEDKNPATRPAIGRTARQYLASLTGATGDESPAPPSTPSPPAPSTGGPGSNSGGSSGGGGSGRGGSFPLPGSPRGITPNFFLRIVLKIAFAICAVTLVLYSYWRTSDKGVQIQQTELAVDLVAEQRKLKEAETKYLREQAKLARRQPRTEPLSSVTCLDPSSITPEPTRLNPIRIGSGCISREERRRTDGSQWHFWLNVERKPREVIADAGFHEVVPKTDEHGNEIRTPEGKLIPTVKSSCNTRHSSDMCREYLQSKIGIPLSVVHEGKLIINF